MAKIKYTDSQISEFLAIAEEIGITRAMRDLGYPESWATGKRWAELRGIEMPLDEVKARAAAAHDWYKTEDFLIVAQEGVKRIYLELTTNNSLLPDDHKKLSEALTKHYDVWAKAQGKATSINETRNTDALDAGLQELLNMETAKNSLRDTEVTSE